MPLHLSQCPLVKKPHPTESLWPIPARSLSLILLLWCILFAASPLHGGDDFSCPDGLGPGEALMVAGPEDQILLKKNETEKCVPASTLKLLTALTVLKQMGSSFRFPTRFYLDPVGNLKIKGYGDPLLVSEVWHQIAGVLADKVSVAGDLILDDSFFSSNIVIPGRHHSTNPYDAPVGALCANFNTVFFTRNDRGEIVSAEPQTPMIPFAREKIRKFGQKEGRYTFTHNSHDAALYAGHLLLHFLKEQGVHILGRVRMGKVEAGDTLIYTYLSNDSLDEAVKKMMAFSNNFMANQFFVALGAEIHGPPGNLEKGRSAALNFARKDLGLADIQVVEGSGISRDNRISAADMLVILKSFQAFRRLLPHEGDVFYKTGSLRGISTRAGYVEVNAGSLYRFAVFLKRSSAHMDPLMACLKRAITDPPSSRQVDSIHRPRSRL